MKVAVVIPTYNERGNIGPLLDELAPVLAAAGADATFWVVDDRSPDGTAAAVHERQGRIAGLRLSSGPRRGLGAAIRRGFAEALAHDPAVVIQMDADHSHRPQDLPALLAAIAGGADLAIGSRCLADRIDARPPHRKLLSWSGSLLARRRLGPVARDCTSGLRAWRATALRRLDLAAIPVRGYAFQVALLELALAAGLAVAEVPADFPGRRLGRSKLRWADVLEFARWAAAPRAAACLRA